MSVRVKILTVTVQKNRDREGNFPPLTALSTTSFCNYYPILA